MRFRHLGIALTPWLFALSAAPAAAQDSARVSNAVTDADGIRVHEIESGHQAKKTQLRVLLPEKLEAGRKYPVLYILPVEPAAGTRWGDGLLEAKKLGLHNRLALICVMPTFSTWPWYADHPTDAKLRQETYFLKVVLPAVEEKYPALAEPAGRLLLGFSKSGWGAFSLLLRRPDVFGRAAAFDAPLAMDWPGKYGSVEVFAAAENFALYRIRTLLEKRAAELGAARRLGLVGVGNFADDHRRTHELLDKLKIAHVHIDGPARKHSWDSGWMEGAAEFLTAPQGGR